MSSATMTPVHLVMLLVVAVLADLPPEPSLHLTPPEPEGPLPVTLGRFPRNDSSQAVQETKPSESEKKLEPQQQEARAILWASPAIPIIASQRGRSSENCNPCDQAPWMPMARALNTQQYALSIPTIHLSLPVNYGLPVSHIKPPSQYDAHPPADYGPPKQSGPPQQNYVPPPPERAPPPPPPPPPAEYGQPPTAGDSRGNNPLEEEKGGLPPPPLPQRFVEPFKVYGPPQPQTQVASASNIKPSAPKYAPLPAPPLPNYPPPPQQFAQPSDLKLGPKLHSNYPLHSPPQHNPRPLAPAPQQYQQGSARFPVLVHAPIPFPSMSKTLLPPFFNYRQFNDGKNAQLHSYMQPPKPQNVVFTIADTEDVCKKCQEKNKAKDSETAQAEHVTQNVLTTTSGGQDVYQKPSVQVVKSVPLAEYLASVEYPMQIIQAPILDVPDLAKYFDLGYHQFPQVAQQKDNSYKVHDQKPAQSFLQQHQQNPVYINHNFNTFNPGTQPSPPLPSGLDNVDFQDEHRHTTNNIPLNHKPDLDSLGKNRHTTEKGFTSSPFQHTTAFLASSTRPNQIFHISKIKPSSQTTSKPSTNAHSHVPSHSHYSQPVSHTISSTPPTKYSTTSGHFVTSKPSDEKSSTAPSSTVEPEKLNDAEQSPSQNHPSTATGLASGPSGPSNFRFLDPPPVDSTGPSDWMRYSFGRGWGHTPPQPFVVPTALPQRARFVNRPTPAPGKKAKHIHQIIVPYTTNKQQQPSTPEPANNLGWTPIPPTNQGRKVPTNIDFGDHYPSTTGLDQLENHHQNIFPTGHSQFVENIPPSAPATLGFGPHQIPSAITNAQQMNLPPHVINQILQLNQQGIAWPSGPDGLQQFLMSNLQGLLRGEEDSVDFARLQKNIDNWTAEGYKQNSPSVNFIPVTAIPHIFNSKKIPEEYLTATEPTVSSSSTHQETGEIYNHNNDIDGAESQKHNVKVYPEVHSKEVDKSEEKKEEQDVIESLLNSWSLLDTKLTSSTSQPSEQTTTESSVDTKPSSEATSKAWEKIQVSISPLTKEKVYVVTPVPVTESSQSTRVERSYSVGTPLRSTKILKPPNFDKTEHTA